ncbi:2-polyprenyl-3-methyl-6-methoxy-1,4-benzoquinone monooxygenase [Noviherbaspirillum sedimenti]|uniref:3-demethoxyubiquinol 3-hydroxylase n=1 Tax=Noviherbaspirillum sedimenti TaxID=2320865 RepID=A0A3A3G2S6_9BURK|nr:2-polyprenyl-3-methyl-6-methoxy-1,4-benzoquinone monooxygenase [Noviherbaspirillum sedimenti]RJG02241.1 2-polyprenyl-3-methyl-6-methoxy-1,4-benzoquinone monooxygenase [Noviherbaspirillum sedimenti]
MRGLDKFIIGLDGALRTVAGITAAGRPNPARGAPESVLDTAERRHSAGLMRVNHVGEVCAQALYASQGLFAKNDAVRQQFEVSQREEEDHLAWTAQRLRELDSRPSLLNPLWYAGAFAIGLVAARLGDAQSLGFVVETERQVEAHLNSHLDLLPAEDAKSRAIVEQMRQDEVAHGAAANGLGAASLPAPVQLAMRGMAKLMTSTAYYL